MILTTLILLKIKVVSLAKLTPEDMAEINQRRQPYTCLGFAYQLAFVRLFNRFPAQVSFEVIDEILTFVSVQLDIPAAVIQDYTARQQTISEHQEQIRLYLKLQRFGESEIFRLSQFLFDEACRLEQTGALLTKAEQFLKEQNILCPAQDTLLRLIVRQREQARQHIYQRISEALSHECQSRLDRLVDVDESRLSPLQALKETPKRASPQAMLRLLEKLEKIEEIGILTVDLSWLNNNYQRSLTHYAKRCSANRLRDLQSSHRYAVLTCFLWQTYRDTIDYAVDMHDKLMTSIYSQAQKEIDEYTRQQRRSLRQSLYTLRTVGQVILDDAIADGELNLVQGKTREMRIALLSIQMVHILVEVRLTGERSAAGNLARSVRGRRLVSLVSFNAWPPILLPKVPQDDPIPDSWM